MRRSILIGALLLVLPIGLGAGSTASAGSNDTREAIARAWREHIDAAKRKDLDAVMEIYADDVRCSHGATTGQLDDEAMFYLRTRGIPYRAARAILLQAFARDVLDTIEVEALRAMLDARIEARFHE